MDASKSISLKLLSQFYRHILSLRNVLRYRFKNYNEEWLKKIENSPELFCLLDNCIVCFNDMCKMSPFESGIITTVSSQTEIVNFVIQKIFMRSEGKPTNIISQGYKRGNDTIQISTAGAFGDAIVNYFPNDHVSFLKSDNWETLLQFVGDRFMIDLLLETSMFMALSQDNYFQFCGIPLYQACPLTNFKRKSFPATRSFKKQKISSFSVLNENSSKSFKICELNEIEFSNIILNENSWDNMQKFKYSYNQIMIMRSKVFYARPIYNSHNKILFGLRHIHLFSHCTDPNNLFHSIYLLVHIFPKQFHLHNVFSSFTDRKNNAQFLKDCTVKICGLSHDRKRKISIPKRLRKFLKIIPSFQRRYKLCFYKVMLDYYCPVKGYSHFDVLDMSRDYVNCHKSSSCLNSKNIQADISFFEMATPYSHVSRFLRAIIKQIIPKQFYGSYSNFENILNNVDMFVRMRRFESISLHSLMNSLKIKTVSWLENNTNCHMSLWDFQKRVCIFSELIYWTFDFLLISLIRSHFYVTESSVYRNKVLYFRHDVWKSLSEPHISRIKSLMFSDLSLMNLKDVNNDFYLGYSYIRLLPKENGVRPIINLKRKQVRTELSDIRNKYFKKIIFMPSINSIVNTIFYVLMFERERNPNFLGSSLFSINDIYKNIKMFKKILIRLSKRLYFVKVDIKNCFDTIDQDKILELITKTLKEDEYILRRFVLITSNFGKFCKKFIVKASSSDDLCHFKKFISEINHLYRHSIIVDQVVHSFKDKDDIIKLLYKHVKGNLVKIGKKIYKQLKGIPQGSILSTILCAYFYGDLEKKYLEFVQQPNTILMRLVDDFLLISLDKSIAMNFLKSMHRGYPEYNCYVNPDKSLVNFKADIDGFRVNRLIGSCEFPYCGNLINMNTLDVKKDYSRLSGKDIDHTLTIEYSHNPGNAILVKSFQLLKLNTHPLFIDTNFNSYYTVLLNIYSSFIFCAMKMHRYMKVMKGKRPSQNRIMIFIEECLNFMLSYLKSRELGALKAKCSVNFDHVKWLSFHAFRKIFEKKQTFYPDVLFKLNLYLSCVKKSRDLKVLTKVDDIGPSPIMTQTFSGKKRRVMIHEEKYLSVLPESKKYTKSFMHRDNIFSICVSSKYDFIITTSIDGYLKFWKKKVSGIEFVKHYKAHLGSIVSTCLSSDDSLFSSASSDKTLKIFDVVNFDMINEFSLGYSPSAVCWVYSKGHAISLLAVSDSSSPTINIYDGRGDSDCIYSINSLHTRPVSIMSGKMIRKYDESLDMFNKLQQSDKNIHKLDDIEFGRRVTIERELINDKFYRSTLNTIFDESSNFIIYPTLLVVNIYTNYCVRLIGKDELLRFINISLYQGAPKKMKRITLAMMASENPLVAESKNIDPILFCSAYKKPRFFMFTKFSESDSLVDRDVFNEKPIREDNLNIETRLLSSTGTSAVIHTTFGDISIRLFPEIAPRAVENFVTHSKNGYYDNTIFHRIIKKFMIQCGDPLGDGTGGESIWGKEFEDEISPELKHDHPYTVSMANAGPNTNGSQFFITTERTPWLDSKHTIFGRAYSGLDVVHAIESIKVDRHNRPTPIDIAPRILNITVL
ncbi:hypothetical protein PORY_001234 [Pneumocystis oryctolagi]|uniref:Uncharacterized protein n=1 Tax=Pneumocystis oryctolagi TaxID=42067 RepID=A0ACB7CBF8_9ASCO|nr:hypothetical protein PORY_001234 [Pneumocystis oryctolagi]